MGNYFNDCDEALMESIPTMKIIKKKKSIGLEQTRTLSGSMQLQDVGDLQGCQKDIGKN